MTNFNQIWKDFIKNDGFSTQKPQKKQKLVENTDIYGKIDENSDKILSEVTEDEVAHIENAIEHMDPDDLAFNSMFSGLMRRIIPFSSLDPDSHSGKFIKFWDKLHQGEGPKGQELGWKWKPDFSTGKVSRNRPIYKTPNDYDEASPVPGKESPKRSLEMMKMGKLLNKIINLATEVKKLTRKKSPIFGSGSLDDNEMEKLRRMNNALYNLAGNIHAIRYILNNIDELRELARFWELTGAALFKNDPNAGKDDSYSIIVTRSPMDILRAADFDKIQSCHSPPSRDGGGSYFKCIVAEAHGHGAVAYIVKTEDLFDVYEAFPGYPPYKTIEDIQNDEEFQTEEVFYDKTRDAGKIDPISRVRLRQFKYESPQFEDDVELAVPEMRTYGQSFEDFYKTVLHFAHNSQEEQLAAAPRTEDDKLDLNKFTIYGGSHEDTGRTVLLTNLFNIPGDDVVGKVKQDTSTEDELPDDLRGLEELYERECQEIKEEWNHRYAAVKTDFEVEDDGAGGAYIKVMGEITLEWDKDDWVRWPHAGQLFEILSELKEGYGMEWISDSYPTYLQDLGGDKIGFTFEIEPEGITPFKEATGGILYAMESHYYNIWCEALNTIDDGRREIKEEISTIAKLQGWMSGGKFIKLARDIEDQEIDLFDWNTEVDGDYPDYYDVTATANIYLEESDLENIPQFSYNQWNTLLNSRDLRLEFRKLLLAEPKQELNTKYNLSIETKYQIPNVEEFDDVRYYVTFNITEDVPDEMVDLFKHTIEETDDEDLLKAILIKAINNVWGNVKQEQMVETLNKKHTKKDAEYFVERWKLNFNR